MTQNFWASTRKVLGDHFASLKMSSIINSQQTA
jgi:hypothetical protein